MCEPIYHFIIYRYVIICTLLLYVLVFYVPGEGVCGEPEQKDGGTRASIHPIPTRHHHQRRQGQDQQQLHPSQHTWMCEQGRWGCRIRKIITRKTHGCVSGSRWGYRTRKTHGHVSKGRGVSGCSQHGCACRTEHHRPSTYYIQTHTKIENTHIHIDRVHTYTVGMCKADHPGNACTCVSSSHPDEGVQQRGPERPRRLLLHAAQLHLLRGIQSWAGGGGIASLQRLGAEEEERGQAGLLPLRPREGRQPRVQQPHLAVHLHNAHQMAEADMRVDGKHRG